MRSAREILVPDIKGWAVVKYHHSGDDDDNATIYGEHIVGCGFRFDGEEAHWCWEWQDAEPNKEDRCWECQKPVPKEIVGLVAMMNWKEIDKSEKV
ncbi:hypothetical protein LCGC14_0208200 [marine sediment metagenome]|uniref:Uncharacterized protein n=1 Tax=marine sediment metagenome TaxID=412755 RepID=A0A0F9UL13_9ZZZZ